MGCSRFVRWLGGLGFVVVGVGWWFVLGLVVCLGGWRCVGWFVVGFGLCWCRACCSGRVVGIVGVGCSLGGFC